MKKARPNSPEDETRPTLPSDPATWVDNLSTEWSEEREMDALQNRLNKWLKKYVPKGCVIHSFGHSMRDRLRSVQCPSDMIDQIGGWTTAGVGQGYCEGYSLDKKWEWLKKTVY